MVFQGQIRPKRRIYCSNTLWPQYRLDNRSQWPENGALNCNTLRDLDNLCHRNGKRLEIPNVQPFFALCSRPTLCESHSTSQILLAHSGPHPPNTVSPDPCSGFSSSFRPQPTTPIIPNPIPDPQPPPYSLPPSLLLKSQHPVPSLCLRQALRPQPHPLP